MAEPEQVARGRLRPARVVHVHGGMAGRVVRVHQHDRDPEPVHGLDGRVLWAQAEADEAVHAGGPDGALQRSVQRRDQEQGQVVRLRELAQAPDQLGREGVGEDGLESLRDQDPDRAAAPHGERAGGRVGRVADLVRDVQDPVQRRLAEALGVVEGEGDCCLRHAGSDRHVSDGHTSHGANLGNPGTGLSPPNRTPSCAAKPI